jgi:hypothetical protein
MRREREELPCVQKFLCKAVQSFGFPNAGKGPKLTKEKRSWSALRKVKWSFGAGLFVYFRK